MWAIDEFLCEGDTKEACIARVKQMQQYQEELRDYAVMIQRDRCPNWLAHLVRETPLEFIGYYALKE